jgi:hypothetical protein
MRPLLVVASDEGIETGLLLQHVGGGGRDLPAETPLLAPPLRKSRSPASEPDQPF